MEAQKVGDDRAVSRIIKLVEDANFNKADIQSYADTFSAQLIPLNFYWQELYTLLPEMFKNH